MLRFEHQRHQQECVDRIVNVLKEAKYDAHNLSEEFTDRLVSSLQNTNKKYSSKVPIKLENRLDVLMETGTGKTFTYLQTIFELNKQFGQKKFIIVLPRAAIKQGVIQQIKLTDDYFYEKYEKYNLEQNLDFIDYPKDGIVTIEQNFIGGNDLSVLITTNSAFNAKNNILNKRTERTLFQFPSVWEGIGSQNPVVFIDEPHLLKGKETTKSLDKLKGSLFIRFGATYPEENEHELSNLVYALDSISSFNNYLVKRIGVSTVFADGEETSIKVDNIRRNHSFDAFYELNSLPYKSTVRVGDDLGIKTSLSQYQGVSVRRIYKSTINLSNYTKLVPATGYSLTNNEIVPMIRETIKLHFSKEERLFKLGIKVLSLFFIPKVDDFRGANPRIKEIFEVEYKRIRKIFYKRSQNEKYKNYLKRDFQDGTLQVHNGYFSGDGGGGRNKDDKEARDVDIILNDKEKLLSFDTSLRFIFSVWALQEGWDNPNIFTICKLSNTKKETSRRQQVGRGLRLAVNKDGIRMTYTYVENSMDANEFYDINTLDIVVSGKEREFIYGIQNEIREASFTMIGDKFSLRDLLDKGLSNKETLDLINVLEKFGIVTYEESLDSYIIRSPILHFLKEHPAKFPNIPDQRLNVIRQLFSNEGRTAVHDNNRKKELVVKIRLDNWNCFRSLWETINKKSTIVYKNIDEDRLVEEISNAFNAKTINPTKIRIEKEEYITQENLVRKTVEFTERGQEYFKQHHFNQFITKLASDNNLSLAFTLRLFSKLDLSKFRNDPKRSKKLLIRLVKERIHNTIVQGVSYDFNETSIYANVLQDEYGNLKNKGLDYRQLGNFRDDTTPQNEFLFEQAVYDSDIERKSIINNPREINRHKIRVFAKLPRIKIPTPYKTYNPDFAYLIEKPDGKQLFLIVETKGYEYDNDIPQDERKKVEYGIKFFKDLQKEFPEIEIKYRMRLSNNELHEILDDISRC